MYRNSGSPADSDFIGKLSFTGRNDNSQDVTYAELGVKILDASDGSEDGRFELYTVLAGTEGISRIRANSTELVINEDSKDLDFRVESDGNANMLFVDGGTNRVGINDSSPSYTLDVDGDINFTGTLREDGSEFSGGISTGKAIAMAMVFG